MILCIANVLDSDTLNRIRAAFSGGELVDGKSTAGWHARLVKNNTQLSGGTDALRQLVRVQVTRNDVFASACLPYRYGPMLFSRYAPGMEYGAHVDDALMGSDGGRMRSDVSFTVFLTDPENYDGGELVMDTAGGEHAYKLPAGTMVAYPSNTLHRVSPVTRGERLVVASWLQSHVRDPARRETLFDLDSARRAMFETGGKSREFDLVSKAYSNLLRMWAET